MFYRKKPVMIEARQWDPDNPKHVLDWLAENSCGYHYNHMQKSPDPAIRGRYPIGALESSVTLTIDTLEGKMSVPRGSYVIRGIRGEFYPCQKDIFEETYEVVDDVRVA